MKLTSKLSGMYKIEVERPDGTRKVLADWFPNLITNYGLNAIGINTTYVNNCQVGSGSTAPAFTDTSLVSRVASTSLYGLVTGITGSSPYYSWGTFTYTFLAGAAAGNLSEVGISSASSGNLFSRALILDEEGDPTTITVLSDEVLYVTYQLRRYLPEVDTEGTVEIDGVTYSFVGRAASANGYGFWPAIFSAVLHTGSNPSGLTYTGTLGTITATPTYQNGTPATVATIATYVADSHETSWTYSFSLSQGNATGGIAAFMFDLAGAKYQFSVDPVIPKTADKVMTITIEAGWGRA
jgi:hypothetical protein